MKKIVAFLLVVILAFSLCACATQKTEETVKVRDFEETIGTPDEFAVPVVSSSDESSADETAKPKYENDVKGLCKYLEDKGCVYKLSEAIKADASLIGADEGYKFIYNYDGGEVVLEVYSYSDTESDWYQRAKNEGKLTLLDVTFDVLLSENGKYLLIYTDSKDRAEREEAVVEIFNSFYAKTK